MTSMDRGHNLHENLSKLLEIGLEKFLENKIKFFGIV
jgi:hypothetical protein